jgi:5-methylcytosine-specific restriction enzyme A
MRRRRLPHELWRQVRRQVWRRDQGRCQGPYCRDTRMWSLLLKQAHIDHHVPITRGGTNQLENLRTLCRRCHVLRADRSHQGMIVAALRDGIIPPNWRELVWDDADEVRDTTTH